MVAFFAKRILSSAVLLLVAMALTFALVFFRGESIARQLLGERASQDQVQLKVSELGLDQPLWRQFAEWLGNAVKGDLGRSWFSSEPVTSAVLGRLGVTLTVVTIVIILTAVLAVLLGLTAAVKRGWSDRLVQGLAIVGAAIPAFIIGMFLVTAFAVQLRIFPATGWTSFTRNPAEWAIGLVLPVVSLLIGGLASTAQQMRSSLIDVLRKDYVRTLRSRGLGEREILFKHVLRSASPPGLTQLALQFVGLLGGVVIVEQVFALPGIGHLAVQSTTRGDLPIVLGVVLVTVVLVVIINLLVDLAIGWLNPKVRVS